MFESRGIPAELRDRRRVAERIRAGCDEYIALLRAQRTPVRIETELARQNVIAMTDELLRGLRLELQDRITVINPDWYALFIDWSHGRMSIAMSPAEAIMLEAFSSPCIECILRDGR